MFNPAKGGEHFAILSSSRRVAENAENKTLFLFSLSACPERIEGRTQRLCERKILSGVYIKKIIGKCVIGNQIPGIYNASLRS